jgi:uncharacterized protein YgbK (DUF1537 family)
MKPPIDVEPIDKNRLLETLPPEWPVDLLPAIREQVESHGPKVVVLDDDPTGTQTVHGVPVLMEWTLEVLRDELRDGSSAFYVLTNSRSLPLPQARALNAEIGRNLVAAGHQANRSFVVISRSDSTLRGHFPGEVEALAEGLQQDFDAWLLIPFFLEGGRYTVNDIHYVSDGDRLVPAGQTEFARDSAFGYRASNLREWVQEKTEGRIPARSVESISLEDIRQGGPGQVAERLLALARGSVCAVNAACYRDLEVFTLGLLTAEGRGKRFLYRTAASMARVRAGIGSRPLLTTRDLEMPVAGGGLVVVGSHVARSTVQLQELLSATGLMSMEVKVDAMLDDRRRTEEIERVGGFARAGLSRGQDVLLYTSRALLLGSDPESSLAVSGRVSSGLIEIVQGIPEHPRYIVAKGGITSSDLATKALGVKRAEVLGQILPGVPVWRLGSESRYPAMPYIVFPGNVGGPRALAEVLEILRRE